MLNNNHQFLSEDNFIVDLISEKLTLHDLIKDLYMFILKSKTINKVLCADFLK